MNPFTNPVLVRELRGRMRGHRAMIILTVYLSIISIVTLLVYLATVSGLSFGTNNFDAGRRVGQAIFLTVMIMALAQVCVITPSLTSGSIAGERERQSYDLLITTLLSPWQVVVGKLMSALAFAFLLITAVLPLAGLSFLFGGVSGIELVLAMVGLLVSAVLYASVGLLWSAIMRSSLGATVMAQGTVLLWLLGVPFLFLVFGRIIFERDGLRDLMETTVFIYLSGAVLCSHPFIALGITQFQLSSGENPFYFTFDSPGAGDEILAPSPWLAYTVIALLIALICLRVSASLVRPTPAHRRRRSGRQQETATPEPPPATETSSDGEKEAPQTEPG
jgi:ABC-type transport system involved in multi-copper enzyme maturation permease subunit